MKSSRRELPQWDAVAGAGMAMPALAHNIHVLTDKHAKTFYCPASHSLGIQLQSAVPAQFVDLLLIPSVTGQQRGQSRGQTSTQPICHPQPPKQRHQKADNKKSIQKTRSTQSTVPVLNIRSNEGDI